MSGDDINFDGDVYNLADLVPPPPGIPPDAVPAATVWVEQLLAVLTAAANADDPAAIAEGLKTYGERQVLTKGAMAEFPENEAQSQAKLEDVSKTAEQIPQMASGIAGGLAGAIGGAFKPLTELPQQLAESIQGFLKQGGEGALGAAEDLPADALDAAALDELSGGPGELDSEVESGGGSGGGGGGGGGIGTAPMSMLGPPPSQSGTTTPTSSRATIGPAPPPAPTAPPAPGGGMGGYPMIPPGAMHGMGGSDKDGKADTKKVSVPSVKNGAPVQGRVAVPPTGPTISKQVEGKTISTRRIVMPTDKSDKADDDKST